MQYKQDLFSFLVFFVACVSVVQFAQAADVKPVSISFLSDYKGMDVDLGKLQQQAKQILIKTPSATPDMIASTLTAFVRKEGFPIAQVVYVPQEQKAYTNSGVVLLHVFWGGVGKVVVKNSTHIHTSRLQLMLADALCWNETIGTDCLLRSTSMERASSLISSQAGVKNFVFNLSPVGVGVGQTAVIATAEGDGQRIHGGISLNNEGVPESGKNMLGLTLSANNLLGIGDVWSAQVFDSSQNAHTGVLSTSIPVGVDGWHAVGEFSQSDFASPVSATSTVTGVSTSYSAGASYPLVLQFDQVVNFETDIGFMNAQSDLAGAQVQELENRSIPYVTVGLSANSGVGATARGGMVWGSGITLTQGSASDNPSATAQDANSLNALHGFSKLNAQYAVEYPLGKAIALDFSARGQLASRNLDYSEAMGVGGPSGLRAYPLDTFGFDDGLLSTVTLRKDYASDNGIKWSPSVYIDYAHGNIYHNTWAGLYQNGPFQNTLTLSDYGVGLAFIYKKITANLTYAVSMPGSPPSITEPNTVSQLFGSVQWGF